MKPTAITAALRRPLSARVEIRRSTALMAVLFLGLGALWLVVKSPSTSSATASSKALGQALKNLPPGVAFTYTPLTTSTTVRSASTTTTTIPGHVTTAPSPLTTTPPQTTTTTTTTTGVGSTTTVRRHTTTTSPASTSTSTSTSTTSGSVSTG
jgi:hypothetical protein